MDEGTPSGLAGRVERLFDAIEDPKTGEVYTSSKIARMSLGDLTEEDVEGLRSGSVADPPLSHVIALARAIGVGPSFLVDGYGEAVFDREIVGALADDTTRTIARESVRLPGREKLLVLGIVQQFEGARSHEEADLAGRLLPRAGSQGPVGGRRCPPSPTYSPRPVSAGSTLS